MIDSGSANIPVEQVQAAIEARRAYDIRVLCIGRGRRQQPRCSETGWVTLDGNTLPRKHFLEAIKMAKILGYQVATNTTVYKETDVQEIEDMFKFFSWLEVDGQLETLDRNATVKLVYTYRL